MIYCYIYLHGSYGKNKTTLKKIVIIIDIKNSTRYLQERGREGKSERKEERQDLKEKEEGKEGKSERALCSSVVLSFKQISGELFG